MAATGAAQRSVIDVTDSTRTVRKVPGSAGPGKIAVLFVRVLPRTRPGSVRDVPWTSTSTSVPTSDWFRASGVGLDPLDEPLEPLVLDVLRHLALHATGMGAAARREDERERVVVSDLVDDLEGLAEVVLGLAGEADDDVGGPREARNLRTQALGEGDVALARVGAAHGARMRVEPDCRGRWTCSQTAAQSRCAAMTSSRMSFGCGLV